MTTYCAGCRQEIIKSLSGRWVTDMMRRFPWECPATDPTVPVVDTRFDGPHVPDIGVHS